MTTVNNTQSALNVASTANQASKAAKSSKAIADNFDQFLTLLTTQLKNQSPLDPLDSNQFTQQLVQFAGVEQQINTNKTLEQLVASNRNSTLTNALGFVGARVTANGTGARLQDGRAAWQFSAPRSGNATINIVDSRGATVYSEERTLSAGDQTFSWDGRSNNGQRATDGQYTIQISAKDATNQTMTVRTEMSGIVDSVDVTGDTAILKIGDISIPMSDVRTIRRN